MHPVELRLRALELAAAGLNDCEVARRTGLPRSTIGEWRRGRATSRVLSPSEVCPRCWRPARRPARFTAGDYAELLALYLGDGCVSKAGRVKRLRLVLDAAHPGIVQDSRLLLARCFPQSPVGVTSADGGASVVLSVYSSHLGCLFPQHAPGKKHERRIELEPWQSACLEAAPWRFLRGCIRSDGCTFVNRTGPYSYLTFEFRNLSSDIRGLFAGACEMVGVEYRLHSERVRINRRSSVQKMVANVGVKA